MKALWLYPLLVAIERGASKPSEIVEIIGSNSATVKKVIYFARRFGLIDHQMRITDEGRELLNEFEILWMRRGRMAVKGKDGCFLIFIRKKGVKALRVPCQKALQNNNPSGRQRREENDRTHLGPS